MLRYLMLTSGFVAFASAAPAQDPIPACETQQELEQVIGSNGEIMPDGCRNVNVSVLESNGQRLCLVDLSSTDDGIVDQLREAAVAEKWWMSCEDLEAAIR